MASPSAVGVIRLTARLIVDRFKASTKASTAALIAKTREPDMAEPEWNDASANGMAFGKKGSMVVPSDANDLDPIAKGIQVVAAGNLVYVPAGNDPANAITVTDAPVGFVPIHQVRRVKATGTTATVATAD